MCAIDYAGHIAHPFSSAVGQSPRSPSRLLPMISTSIGAGQPKIEDLCHDIDRSYENVTPGYCSAIAWRATLHVVARSDGGRRLSGTGISASEGPTGTPVCRSRRD